MKVNKIWPAALNRLSIFSFILYYSKSTLSEILRLFSITYRKLRFFFKTSHKFDAPRKPSFHRVVIKKRSFSFLFAREHFFANLWSIFSRCLQRKSRQKCSFLGSTKYFYCLFFMMLCKIRERKNLLWNGSWKKIEKRNSGKLNSSCAVKNRENFIWTIFETWNQNVDTWYRFAMLPLLTWTSRIIFFMSRSMRRVTSTAGRRLLAHCAQRGVLGPFIDTRSDWAFSISRLVKVTLQSPFEAQRHWPMFGPRRKDFISSFDQVY